MDLIPIKNNKPRSAGLDLLIDLPQSHAKAMAILLSGDRFGEETILSGTLHPTSAQALTDCRLRHVCKHAFFAGEDRAS